MILFDFHPEAKGKTLSLKTRCKKVLISENKAIVEMTALSFGLLVADMSLLCNFTENTLIGHDKSLLYLQTNTSDYNQ